MTIIIYELDKEKLFFTVSNSQTYLFIICWPKRNWVTYMGQVLRWRHNGRDGVTSLTIVYSTVYTSAAPRKHESSASLAFVRGIHRWPVNSPHKGPVTRKMSPIDDVIMTKLEIPLQTILVGNVNIIQPHSIKRVIHDWKGQKEKKVDTGTTQTTFAQNAIYCLGLPPPPPPPKKKKKNMQNKIIK